MLRRSLFPALALTALLFAAGPGCAASPPPARPLLTALPQLRPGMSQAEVTAILGEPLRSEFSWSMEAWHYCRPTEPANELAVIVFLDGKVIEARGQRATGPGAHGDCRSLLPSAGQALGPHARDR